MPQLIGMRWFAAGCAGLVLLTACEHPERPPLNTDLVGPLAPYSTLGVAATTSNSDASDPDGYTVRVDVSSSQHVDPNGLATFTGIADGPHRVDLYDLAANCWAMDNDPRAVSVIAGLAGATQFDVGCVSEGSVYITNTTTGVDLDPDGFTIAVDGSATEPLATNDGAWFNGVSSYGSHTVALSDVAGTCTVGGANPQTFTVAAGQTAALSFSVTCAPTGSGSGTLTVLTSTTGVNPDPDGYTLTLDGTTSQAMGPNDGATFTVQAGDHPVALSGVAANCTVSDANPRTATVPADGAGTTTFAVTCGAAPPARVVAEGQLKMGAATLGNVVQTFNLDVRADGTGHFAFTDYGNTQANGNPAMLIADPAADPETAFTAYRNGSTACADPARGAEFDGIGRDPNDGTLVAFTVEVCDNGPPGTGTDFFSLYAPPPKGYGRSGILTSGDVAKP